MDLLLPAVAGLIVGVRRIFRETDALPGDGMQWEITAP
jgi:hypothetical protein